MHKKWTKLITSQLFKLCSLGLVFCSTAYADPVWHCTRTDVQVANAGDNFSLAALDTEREVIRISLRDLYGVYQGQTVKASGIVVSACFVGVDSSMTKVAMKSIGAEPKVLEQLSRQSNLVGSHVYAQRGDRAVFLKHISLAALVCATLANKLAAQETPWHFRQSHVGHCSPLLCQYQRNQTRTKPNCCCRD
jgi:hypothetical protein